MIERIAKISILILMLIPFWSCSKKEDNSPQYYKLSQEFIDWFYFKPGSYWVYKNVSTAEFDSLIVDSASIAIRYYPYGSGHANPFYYDYLKVTFKPNFMNITYDDVGGGGGAILCRNFNDSIVYPIFNPERNIKGEILNFYNFSHLVCTTEVLDYLNLLQIENNHFYNVMIVQVKDLIKIRTVNFYLVKEIGTIKFQIIENNDTLSWIVENWHVNK